MLEKFVCSKVSFGQFAFIRPCQSLNIHTQIIQTDFYIKAFSLSKTITLSFNYVS